MFNKQYFKCLFLLALTVCLVACSGNKKSDPAYFIPNNAYAVVNFNLGNLHQDGKLAEFNKTKIYTQLTSILGMYAPDVRKGVETLAENSDNTGLDLKSDALYFAYDKSNAIVFRMKDEAKFLKFAKDLTGKSGAFTKEPKKVDNFLTVAVNDKNQIIGWDGNYLIFFEKYDAKNLAENEAEFKKLINLDEKDSYASTAEFTEFNAGKKDISFMLDMDKITPIFNDLAQEAGQKISMPDYTKGMIFNAFIDFATDEISVTGTNKGGKIDYAKLFNSTMTGTLNKYFPESMLGCMASNVNLPETMKYVKPMLAEMSGNNSSNYLQALNLMMPIIEKLTPNLTGESITSFVGFKTKNLALGSLAANAFVDLSGIPTPVFAMALATKKPAVLNEIGPLLSLLKKSGDKYILPLDENLTLTIAETQDALLISNDASYLQDAISGKYNASGFGKNIKANTSFLRLNPQYMPENFNQALKQDPFLSSLSTLLSAFDKATFEYGKDYKSFTAKLQFKQSGNNAFYQIMQMIEQAI